MLKERFERLMPGYSATGSGPSERGLLSCLMAIVMFAMLWAVFAWADTDHTPDVVPTPLATVTPKKQPKATPSPNGTSSSVALTAEDVAAHPAAWRPQVRPFSDSEAYGHLPGYKATVQLRSPFSGRTKDAKGAELYEANCLGCHLADGKSNPSLRVPARDLSVPIGYQYGSTDGAIFRSIKFGIPRASMGRFKGRLTDTEIWHVVAHVKGLRR